VGLAGVVTCAAGLTVTGRDAPLRPGAPRTRLLVGPVGPVVLPEAPPMEAHRGDGHVWRRHWASDGRLIVDFVDIARVSVGADGTVTFDRTLDPELEEHLLFDHILPLVLAGDGHLVLHGGIISLAGRGVALIGSSGAGKSTLTGFSWRHGWTVGNDDGVVLSPAPQPSAEPTYTTLRLTPAGAELVGIDVADTSPVVGKLRLDGRTGSPFRQEPVPLRVVAVIEPDELAAEASFEPLSGMDAHAELFGSTFHSDFARDQRLPQVLTGLANIIESSSIGRLRVPRGRSGLASTELLLRSLLDQLAGP